MRGARMGRRGARGLAFGATGAAAVALLLAAAAPAATVTNERPLLFSFDGHDTTAGAFQSPSFFVGPAAIARDRSTGALYVIDASHKTLDKFDSEGHAQSFAAGPAAGTSSLFGPEAGKPFDSENEFFFRLFPDVAVDNSEGHGGLGEGEQGRIYISGFGGPVDAFKPNGEFLWELPREAGGAEVTKEADGIAVDPAGHLWVATSRFVCSPCEWKGKVLEFDTTGAGPPSTTPLPASFEVTRGNHAPGRLAFDQSGKGLYLALRINVGGEDEKETSKYVEATPGAWSFDSTLTTTPDRAITVDQSSAAGHIFALEDPAAEDLKTKLREFEPCSTPGCSAPQVPGSPFGGDLIGDGRGIAYNPTRDWVYVADHYSSSVKAFGPVTSGIAPDVKNEETTAIGRKEATVHGTVDPLSLPHSAYHFEWKEGTGADWGAARSSPPVALPVETNEIPVSFPIGGLRANTEYQVRLVGTNTEAGKNLISSYASPPATFKTLLPPPPTAKIDEIINVTTESAEVKATIGPEEDQTTWRVLRAALPGATKADCEALPDSGFAVAKEGTISVKEAEEHETIAIAANLTGLEPAETSCVRVWAKNGNPNPGRADERFITGAVIPTEARIAFTAPRTDTTATVNAWVNPQGEAPLSYRFEWSEDGAHWTEGPQLTSTAESREPILVAEGLTNLKPSTTYLYRLASVENEAGSETDVTLPSQARSFTTRSTEEVRLPPNAAGEAEKRGIELVNPPDKGTQNVVPNATLGGLYRIDPAAPSGEEMLWSLTAGAPGANTATGDVFLAKRSGPTQAAPNGWESKSLIPPAAEQLGGGRFRYLLEAATPGFGRFFFKAGEANVGFEGAGGLVRVNRGGGEEVLSPAANVAQWSLPEASADGNHFILIDESGRLVDLEAPGKEALLSTMPDGAPAACALRPGSSWPGFGSNEAIDISHRTGYSLIARDASRVYFQVQRAGECGAIGEANGPYALYVRNRETNKTTLIDPGSAGQSPELIRATPDGKSAYYVTRSHCRRWKYEGPSTAPSCKEEETADGNGQADVYLWEEASGHSSCLTCQVKDEAGGTIEGADIASQTAVIVSDDFSHVYFSSEAQLVPGEGNPGGENLYVLAGGVVRFVAGLAGGPSGGVLKPGIAEASADGGALLFSTLGASTPPRRLSGDDIAPLCPNLDKKGGPPTPCNELYRYDAPTASLECLSCLRGGLTTQSFRPTQVNSISRGLGITDSGFALSADGSTVAFTTAQALVPGDVNNGIDVYEWRNGQIRLITDGVTKFAEGLSVPGVAALDADGSNLFFAVDDPGLTGWEHDELRNLYDARIGGGFPRPSPPAHCEGESCQGPLQTPPLEEAPLSGGQTRGNVEEGRPRCPRGRVRHHRRCVKPHKHRHRKRSHRRVASHSRGGVR